MSFSLYHHPLSHCWKHCRQHLTRFVFAGISLSALSAALMLSAPTQASPLRHNPMPQFFTSISACAAYQDESNRWSDSYRVELGYYDGWHLARMVRGFRGNSDDLFAVFIWSPGTPVIVNLQNRPGLSTASTVVRDVEGRNWRLSRTWRNCSRNF